MRNKSFSSLSIRAVKGKTEKSFMIMSLISCSLLSSLPVHSAVFNISSGDVTGLIAAISTANANGEENTINLAPGTYNLTSIDNSHPAFGNNGLPVTTGTMTINGESAETTIIERNSAAPPFRIFLVGAGRLTLNRLTIRGGLAEPAGGIINQGTLSIIDSIIDGNFGGSRVGGIFNLGTITMFRSIVTNNGATFDGGGISNRGTANIISSTIAHNRSEGGGGVQNGIFQVPGGTMRIENSTISNNTGDGAGGIQNSGMMTITNSSIANNFNPVAGTGGISNSGGLKITNSTIAGNSRFQPGPDPDRLSGIRNFLAEGLELQNTIVDQCSGPITSLGNNVIADLADCGINLLSSDLTGDPGLGAFIDDGVPGHGRFPLLETSQAIDRGNNDACSSNSALPSDQLSKPRFVAGRVDGPRICDIGAVEFFPIVNELVQLREGELTTEFDSTPLPEAPAGTFVITAHFENSSNETIFFPFFEVVTLELQRTIETPPEGKCPMLQSAFRSVQAEDQPVLLNADGGPARPRCFREFLFGSIKLFGTAGARMTPQDSLSNPLERGETSTFQFRIGLQKKEPFTFLVNILGERRTSNTSVRMPEQSEMSIP